MSFNAWFAGSIDGHLIFAFGVALFFGVILLASQDQGGIMFLFPAWWILAIVAALGVAVGVDIRLHGYFGHAVIAFVFAGIMGLQALLMFVFTMLYRSNDGTAPTGDEKSDAGA